MAKVMVIDDDLDLTEMLSAFLGGEGHEVRVHNEMAGAIDAVLKDVPDIIVLDVMFPSDPSGGLSLAIKLRKQAGLEQVPIIMLTNVNQHFPIGFSEKDIDPTWMPIEHFIEKPIDPPELAAMISKCVG